MDREKHLSNFRVYLRDRDKGRNTVRTYISVIRGFLDHINKQTENINLEDILKYKRHIKEKHKDTTNTLTPKYSAVKAYLKFIGKTELLEDIQRERLLDPPKWKIPPKNLLTKAELRRFFKLIEKHPRNNAFFKTLYYSAQRVDSIIKLNISDINWETETIHVKAKMGKEYDVDIHSEALEAIKEYIDFYREKPKRGHSDAVFLNGTGERISYQAIYRITKIYGTKLRLKKNLHHTFSEPSAFHSWTKEATAYQIKQQSGHSSIKTLDTYIHPDKRVVKSRIRTSLNLDDTKKPTPPEPQEPTDTLTQLKIKELELELTRKEAEIELLKLKQKEKNKGENDNPIYG